MKLSTAIFSILILALAAFFTVCHFIYADFACLLCAFLSAIVAYIFSMSAVRQDGKGGEKLILISNVGSILIIIVLVIYTGIKMFMTLWS